jgi:HEAT repeat protein
MEKEEPAAIPIVLELLNDDDEDVRRLAIGSFYMTPPAFAAPFLRKALQHTNPLVRAGAADASILLDVNRADAEQTALGLLSHSKVEVRLQAIRGLEHEDRPCKKEAVPILCAALKDENARIQKRLGCYHP